jgi:hemerythrin-like domain-containing protein
MKRIQELQILSEDHHHGLVLARKAKKTGTAADKNDVHRVWLEVEQKFKTELDNHFRIEEKYIAPYLESCGESELVQQLLDEHKTIRACVDKNSSRTASALQRFGELLENHIRFEERELFETAQEKLSPEELADIAEHSGKRR